jgi:hypothetical protein
MNRLPEVALTLALLIALIIAAIIYFDGGFICVR